MDEVGFLFDPLNNNTLSFHIYSNNEGIIAGDNMRTLINYACGIK